MNTVLSSLLPEEIEATFPIDRSYRAQQIFGWIQKGITEIDAMTNIPAPLKSVLKEKARITTFNRITPFEDPDGTVKHRITLEDGLVIESVLLSDPCAEEPVSKTGKAPAARKTICLSSQAGCGMGCRFCKTGTMGFKRNLAAHEIVEQFLSFKREYGDIRNIVFMGMGEPLLNLEAIKKAIAVLHHPGGNNIGIRKFTISTCGIENGIRALAEEGPPVRLAVSLITADEKMRKTLMPCAVKQSLKTLKDSLLHYQKKTKSRITLEIVLIRDTTDRPEDIASLKDFIRPLRTSVNLIPLNPVPELPYARPENERIVWFKKALESAGITVTQRYRKGTGINAACGQLAF
ncbi:MAG: 23S rRNA (adenine(2503)-C(2))-methyltransferase RlmN [Spirochaetales bacterium]|nr:23S rRNA (adenine(2503)-C(2))-methyltransferase RlmN [Spirochaetales bacterium]